MCKIIFFSILISALILAYFIAKQHKDDDPFFF